MKYIKTFEQHDDYVDYTESQDYVTPNLSYCINEDEAHFQKLIPHDYSLDYFTTVAREGGTITFHMQKNQTTTMLSSMSYSVDNGETWVMTNNVNSQYIPITVNVNTGDKVLWKGVGTQTGYYDTRTDNWSGSFFTSTARFDVCGNIMSLLFGNDFMNDKTTLDKEYQFAVLFSPTVVETSERPLVVNAKNLILPATTLYSFCYYDMFAGCTSLKTAPELPATTLANNCYETMFFGCTSLTAAPELPAMTLAQSCYSHMFTHCTSLTTAPKLPATNLVSGCYDQMFTYCTSLTTAPELPATTLVNSCYNGMFTHCSSLNYIKAMCTTAPASRYTYGWVYDVAASGTFVKNSAASWDVTGNDGVPSGWTVQTASA